MIRNPRNLTKPTQERDNYLRIFVLECPNPLDLIQARSEGPVIETIGKLIGHEVFSFFIRSKRELRETCRYVSSIDPNVDGRSLCLHISAHGDSKGLRIGAEDLNWEELAEAIATILRAKIQFKGKRIVVLSACQAEQQKLTNEIAALIARQRKLEKAIVPPEYLFCTSGNVPWQDAAVGWTLFYHLLPDADLDNKVSVQRILNNIKAADVDPIYYFRWDKEKKKYLKYASTLTKARGCRSL